MRNRFEVIALAALVSVVAFKLFIGPGKTLTEAVVTTNQRSIFGLHIAQPSKVKDFPVKELAVNSRRYWGRSGPIPAFRFSASNSCWR